ncbi:GntR family transcriptional regulator [Paraburkholderia caballeronis]|uniref:DNA-binding transcriptional regulator, GntR family n=1 Tax=Paraburkholderia caballeronis TaxID=416943 RepID=A0A1H7T073_9BURK|nr:GntR family transcriptional regulator [Paraburkholderia caballeronis]PXW25764.1 DNA-binding GntR family transcriptional regulator [Paraburkholderia caballeronis]PXX01371.1 DNA-binding GntR family transcriptional regulator [Paraburkholderia caballeronis]RAJ99275.1 DNA-binding GntR family transcriptional regulator [Paraburkholderia caballeronis]SEE23434.1 DNA-binding transcriptional regulator, GntR family [Paraburkholderia caballeronis]SEL78118.1 DNA-binding transcriptional regulator, GntR fa
MAEMLNSGAGAGQTLSSAVANTLRMQITSGAMPPGKKINLEDLRADLGVSLSPLREALSRLAAEGFVSLESNRGYRVAPVSEPNLVEVTRLRTMLETFALRESIRLGDNAWESSIVAGIYQLNKRIGAKNVDLDDWEITHRTLHHDLLAACGMPLVLHFCSILHDLNDRYRRMFLEGNSLDPSVADEHANICSAALARDADKACALLKEHIERTGMNVAAALRKRKPSVPAT